MITSSRRRAISTLVTRRFEFDRFQKQSIASAYEALIPVVSTHPKWPRDRAGDLQSVTTRSDDLPFSAVGA
jgi:tellurite resistance protein